MYPFIRVAFEYFTSRNLPSLPPGEPHISKQICLPWDLDGYMEMNNGRMLTLLDSGRFIGGKRSGFLDALKANSWAMTMAGVYVRYRRRVRLWQRYEVHTKFIGFDDKFLYVDQTMWRKGECLCQAVYRAAFTDKSGLVRSDVTSAALGLKHTDMPPPDWVQAWIAAEEQRPWPPK